MNFIKRALLSVQARKGKSFLQVFIFTVICVLVLSGLSIQSAAQKSADLARKQLGGEVTLQVDREKLMQQQQAQQQSTGERVRFQSVPIPETAAKELTSLSQVKGYNFYTSTFAVADGFEAIENEAAETSSEEQQDNARFPGGAMGGTQADVTIQGVMFTDAVQEFMDGDASIVEGRHLTEDDAGTNVTVIEKTLAKQNELTVGQTIKVTATSGETAVELEIVGIYETTATNEQGANFAALNPYNKLYVPYTATAVLKGTDYEGTIDSAVYYMNDPANLQDFLDQAKATSSIDFDTFKLDANDQLYQQMIGPITNVASFSKNIVYLVTVAGAIILGLIVMLSIRERKYEMGVLLAIGEKKWKLIGQFIIEIIMVAVLALGISTVSGNVIANQIGEQLLSQELQQTEETAANPASFGGRGMGFGMGPGSQAQQQADPVDELKVEVTSEDLGMLAMIGFVVAVLSALLPSLSVLRLQPKTILTKQD